MFLGLELQIIWRQLRLILLFLLAFVLVSISLSLVLRKAAPMPDMIVLSPKLAHYKAHAADYDTVFIGTSRTLYHIVPEKLDEGAIAAGCPAISAFNFGIHGLNGSEEDWLIEQVMAIGAGHLKRVIIEGALPEARKPGQVTTPRTRYFHGPANYKPILESIWSFPEIAPKHLFRTGILAYGIGYDLSGVGRGAELVFPGPDPVGASTMNLTEHGFEALDEVTSDDIVKRREDFLDRADEFDGIIAAYDADLVIPNLDGRADFVQTRIERVEARGLAAGFYVSPDPMELGRTPLVGHLLAKARPDLTILNFNQPDLYPELFDRSLWQDYSHLSRLGAETFSLELGRTLCEQTNSEAG